MGDLLPPWSIPNMTTANPKQYFPFPESFRVTKISLKPSPLNCLFSLYTMPLGAPVQNAGDSISQEGKQTPGTEQGRVYQTQTLPAARQEDRVKRERGEVFITWLCQAQ